jgi:hypothetical protein
MDQSFMKYVLITPARNEAQFIGGTLDAVVAQSVLPEKWVIVSDGSTDGTDDIVRPYLEKYPWIELVRRPEDSERSFAAKVHSFNAGYEKLKGVQYDVIGNLDADITFEPNYFEFLLSKFAANPQLGVAGTPFVEGKQSYDFRYTAIEHVSGACQMFRRECFEQIGGYMKVKGGGIDWIAVTTARMKGWLTRSFVEMSCHHHRPMGTASAGKLKANFRLGGQDYYLGGHPAWQLFRSVYQSARPPLVVGGAALLAGYCWAWISGVRRPVSSELVRFHQAEQMRRLREKLFGSQSMSKLSQVNGN